MDDRTLLERLAALVAARPWLVECDALDAWLTRLESRPPLVVVVPIYDGAEHLARLVGCEALWREAPRVVFVDDCSSDARIEPLLASITAAHPQAEVLRNQRNLGFVKSVNRGLRHCTPGSDVLVLNSDTLVAHGWSTALCASAYAYPNVATVSPLSNNAGFFSLPRANEPNPVPAGWSVEACSRLLGWLAPVLHEEPTASCGFCWYVRADAVAELGLLDERMFRRGYAEETDFCLRAADAGRRNLASFVCYVAHTGGESFTSEKSALKRNNARVLSAMQPTFLDRLRAYEARSQLRALGELFGRLTASGQDVPVSLCPDGPGLTLCIGRLNTRAGASEILAILVGETGLTLELGLASLATGLGLAELEALASYLVLRLRPARLVDEARIAGPMVARAARLVGTTSGAPAAEASP